MANLATQIRREFTFTAGQVLVREPVAVSDPEPRALSAWGMMTLGLLVLTAGIVAILRPEKSLAA